MASEYLTANPAGLLGPAAAVPGRIVEAWAANDAADFAAAFAADGAMILPGDVCLKGRDASRSFMADRFDSEYKGGTVTGNPLDARLSGPTAAVVATQGDVLFQGDISVTAKEEIRATWVLAECEGQWPISVCHDSRTANA